MSGAPVLTDWHILPTELLALWAWTLSMLFLPRVLGCWPSSCGVSSSSMAAAGAC